MGCSVEIRLLGRFEVRRDGEPVALPRSRKARALLAYLVATGRPHARRAYFQTHYGVDLMAPVSAPVPMRAR